MAEDGTRVDESDEERVARERAETRKAEADARLAEARASKAEADVRRAEAEADRIGAEADLRKAEAERATAEARRLQTVEAEKAALAKKASDAEIRRAKANEELIADLGDSGPGVREFVRQSLLDIMEGVDDAAAMGRLRATDDGLERFLPAVTMIGGAPAEGRTERVEFDLAVTVNQTTKKTAGAGGKAEADFKVGVFGVGKLHVGASGHIERVVAEGATNEQTNRLRFAVPISYAVQHDANDG